jgi:hypothetical protein
MTLATEQFAAPRLRRPRRSTSTPHLMRRRRAIFLAGLALLGAFLAYKLLLGPTGAAWIGFLREDGLVETSETLYLLVAAAFALGGAWRLRRRGEPTLAAVYALLGVCFFFVGMEEISWGQRMFGVASPEFFRAFNAQEELTIHNLGPVQVVLDYAYFGLGIFGAFAWVAVAPLERLLLAPQREGRSRRLLRGVLLASAVAGVVALVTALVLTPARVTALGLVNLDPSQVDEALQRHIGRLHDYRLAAAGLGAALLLSCAALLVRFDAVWRFLTTRFARLERMLVPRWHLSVFFLPACVHYAIHIFLPHAIDSRDGLGGFLIQQDEEVAEFMLYVGWMIFFYLRFLYLEPRSARSGR